MSQDVAVPPKREILIARHGHAHCNADRVIAGPTCAGLTEQGRVQVFALTRRLADEGAVLAIYSSTTPRALESARIVGRVLGVAVQECPDLRVPDSGAAEGQVWADARARWGTDADNPTRPLVADGEPWTDYMERAAGALTEIIDRHPGGRVLVVGHTETIAAMYGLLLGTSNLGRLKVELGYCGLSTWRAATEWPGAKFGEQRWSLVSHNDGWYAACEGLRN